MNYLTEQQVMWFNGGMKMNQLTATDVTTIRNEIAAEIHRSFKLWQRAQATSPSSTDHVLVAAQVWDAHGLPGINDDQFEQLVDEVFETQWNDQHELADLILTRLMEVTR